MIVTVVESVDDGASPEENIGTDCTFDFDDTVVGDNHAIACMRQTHFEAAAGVAVGVAVGVALVVAVGVYLS